MDDDDDDQKPHSFKSLIHSDTVYRGIHTEIQPEIREDPVSS